MKPCPKCGSKFVGQVLGIFWDEENKPHHVSFNCTCGSTRGLKWDEAPEDIRHEAVEQYKLSLAMDGLV